MDRQAELSKRKRQHKIAELWFYLSIVASFLIIFTSTYFLISGVSEYYGVDTNQNAGLIKLAIGLALLIGEIIFQPAVVGKLMKRSLGFYINLLLTDVIFSTFDDEETIKEELEKLDKQFP